MNADAFRHFYEYHFSENRATWDRYVMSLSQEQFTQPLNYSVGSVRNQLVHLMSVDNIWFCDLRGVTNPSYFDPDDFDDRETLRAKWDQVERGMREYLGNLRDDTLLEKPLKDEDENLIVWQVLLQVVNHGTDHRAQLLRQLHDLGIKTVSQDYIFYVYDHP
jgi:uncharacterized damage-inducible protein DinB